MTLTPVTFTASQPHLLGPDVSHYQGTVDGRDLARRGFGFLIYKVGQGVGFVDPSAPGHRDQARANRLLEGRYFFLEDDARGGRPASGAAQADAFVHQTLALGRPESCGHAVDVELQDKTVGPSIRVVRDFVNRWRQRMPGHPLGVYSGAWYWVGHLGNPSFPGDWLWSSDYITGSGDAEWLVQHGGSDRQGVTPGFWPHPWGHRSRYDLRQFTAAASCGGRAGVDCSVFPGTRSQLERLWLPASAPHPAPTPAPAPRPAPKPGRPTTFRLVDALQGDVHVDRDGKWGNGTDAALQAVRHNRHDRPEQAAVGATVDGRWGPKSQAAYAATVKRVQRDLSNGGFYKGRVDGAWGPQTDRAFLAARSRYYGRW